MSSTASPSPSTAPNGGFTLPEGAWPKGHPLPADKFVKVGRCASTQRDITICYNTFGQPENPCLLFVCGLGSQLLSWRTELCEKLVAAGFFVVRFDNRDVGLSTHLDDFAPPALPRMILPAWLSVGEGKPAYTLDDMAMDGLNLLSALGIEKAHVMGVSMGGMIVQCMAILHPERILSLNIFAAHCGGPSVKPQSMSMTFAFLDGPTTSALEDVLEYKLRHYRRFLGDFDITPEEFNPYYTEVLKRSPDDSNALVRQMWAVQRAASREEALRQLPPTVRVLILHGLKDTMVPLENGLHLAELIAGAKVVLFPRMGHSLPPMLYDRVVEELQLHLKPQ